MYRDGRPVDPALLTRMHGTLAHRGGDGSGQWLQGSVGLGHHLRFNTPESRDEQQPFVHALTGVVLVADARIDNRGDLLRELRLQQAPASKTTDGHLILAAYLAWGAECPAHLIGAYAFALYDSRSHSFFCARDHMGFKPLYYHLSGRLFAVSSEIKALLAHSDVPTDLNEGQIRQYLEGHIEGRTETYYASVNRLPAAHWMRVDVDQVRKERYWSLDPGRTVRYGTQGEYIEAFRDVFDEAVRCRVRSAGPVSSTLSGGLDSSSIVATAQRQLAAEGRPPLHTFSAIFPSLPPEDLKLIDERDYIDAVLRTGDFVAHRFRADLSEPFVDLNKVLHHLDDPLVAYNLYMHWGLFSEASRHGVRVMLDGTDGDTAVGHGLARLSDLALSGQWSVFGSEFERTVGRSNAPQGVWLAQYAYPLLAYFAGHGRMISWWKCARELSRRFDLPMSRLLRSRGIRPLVGRLAGRSFERRPANGRQQQVAGISAARYQWMLELVDKAATAFGLELRYPFFDRRFLEFSVALPLDQKLSNGWPRAILRNAMEGRLPAEVRWRFNKQNLLPNFVRGVRAKGLEAVRDQISYPGPLHRYADINVLDAVSDRFFRGGQSRSRDGQDALHLFRAFTTAAWLKRGDTRPDPSTHTPPPSGVGHIDAVRTSAQYE